MTDPRAGRPLTERMRGVLSVLATHDAAMTPNQIGYSLGFKDGGTGGGHGNGRGSGHRVFGPAQRVNFPLTALRKRGLVGFAPRPDGHAGMAYEITDDGRAALAAEGPDA